MDKLNKSTVAYKVVDGVLIWIRKDITDFTIPDGVIDVLETAIHRNIRRLVFADSVEHFTIPKDNSIEEILLPKEIRRYREVKDGNDIVYVPDSLGLENLKNLKNIGIPIWDYGVVAHGYYHDETDLSVERIFYAMSLHCSDKVIIRYDSDFLDDKYSLLPKYFWLSDYIKSMFSDDQKKIVIEFVGPELSKKRKREVIKWLKEDGRWLGRRFVVLFSGPQKEQTENYDIETNDNEIQALLDEIKVLCERLPEESKRKIMDKANGLVSDYLEKLDKFRPSYEKVTNLQLEVSDVSTLKPSLIASLEGIKLSLSSEHMLIKLLSEIGSCMEFLKTEVHECMEEDSLKAKINNIIYYANTLDDNRKKIILDKLNKLLNEANSNITNQLSAISDSMILTINSPVDYHRMLEDDISSLLDETKLISNKVVPYRNLLTALTSDSTSLDGDKNNICYMINAIRYILSNIGDDQYKKELDEKFKEIFDKYRNKISAILGNDELLKESKYEDLELSFRKEIDSVLKLTSKYAYLDQIGIHGFNVDNIRKQLNESIQLIENGKFIPIDENISSKIIISFAAETLNMVLSHDEINENETLKIVNDLKDKLKIHFEELNTNEIKSAKEYNEVVRKILSSIAMVYVNVILYINDIKSYERYTK